MFAFSKPTQSLIEDRLEAARRMPLSYATPLGTKDGMAGVCVPLGYALDHSRSEIGYGSEAFASAKLALRHWLHFDLGWVRVANLEAKIEPGETVAVEAHSLGLWSVNLSRILYIIDEPHRFGFGYGTTPLHVERGEERFLLEHNQISGAVYYDLLAVSQPAHWMAWLGYPYTRSQQQRFARGSHRRIRQALTYSP
jgi:uncharacterized protein (UPF0548 family)